MATRRDAAPKTAIDLSTLPASSLYLVLGTDEFLVSENSRKLVEHLCPAADRDFGLEVVDPAGTTVADATDALAAVLQGVRTMGFFGGRKVVWLRDTRFMDERRTAQSELVKDLLVELVEEVKKGLMQGTVLVMTCGKLDKRQALFKTCKENGALFEFSQPDKGWQKETHARQQAKSFITDVQLKIDEATLDAFMVRTGVDTRQIAQEVEKLSLFAGSEGSVSIEDIRAIVSPSREAVGWDLMDAVADRDLPRAIRTFRQLTFQNESVVGTMVLLENRFRELLVIKQCLQRGFCRVEQRGNYVSVTWREGGEVEEKLSPLGRRDPRKLHSFRVGKLCGQAQLFSRRELLDAEERCMETHEKIVTGSSSAIQLEILLVRLLTAKSTP